jgi:3-phenylpropionate/trans-cinnamate dioxygenase ferredoxin reductase subunit
VIVSESVDVLIIGGGIAGASAAAELRAVGHTGSTLLVTRELEEPYERPPVTKGLLLGTTRREDTRVHPAEWWSENRIELRTRASVLALDPTQRVATLASKETIQFGKAILATGATVRRLQVDGAQLEGIHYLRAPGNAEALRADIAEAQHVTVIGGSYIGCEVAASLAAMGKRCTVLMQEDTPLERGFGPTVGAWVASQLTDRGVEVIGGITVDSFAGDTRVSVVLTNAGYRTETDAVVLGIGALPDVTLARKAGLLIGDTGGILCSRELETSAPGIYAAGDACEYESVLHGTKVRIEHHEHAAAQGRTAARNIAGIPSDHTEVPYFWTDLADWATLEYVGVSPVWDEEQIHGSLDSGNFIVRYSLAGRLVGALACGVPDELDIARAELATAVLS